MPTENTTFEWQAALAERYPRVALVHDWLNGYRGGERVLEAIAGLFPKADIFTLFYEKGRIGGQLEKHRIQASWLNGLPGAQKNYRYLLPLFPMTIERFDLTGYDLVISSSHCVAKGIIPGPRTPHLCYCHTTMRYVWDQQAHYFGRGLKSALLTPALHYLRQWDVASSARVDTFLANSAFVADRIRKYYRREAEVVWPFVDLETFRPPAGDRGDYYLIVSAFVPYKRLDLAIEACRTLGRKLLIVGNGPEEKKLRQLASGNADVRFLGALSSEELRDVYSGARAMLFPGEEDFGITPLEAMACGTPVIAYGRGGATETVVDGETGAFFHEQTAEALAEAIARWEARPASDLAQRCYRRAQLFSRREFEAKIARAALAQAPANLTQRINRSTELNNS